MIKEWFKLEEFFIVSPFKPIWYIILLIGVLFCVIFINHLKTKTQKEKRNAIIVLYTVGLLIFVLYKILAVYNPRYYELCRIKGVEPMKFWDELPLQMCSLNFILILIAAIFNLKYIYMYVFYVSTLGAVLAIMSPYPMGRDALLFEPTIWGYYVTHLLIAMEMPIIYHLDLYKPKYKDIPIAVCLVLMFGLIFTIINIILRSTGLSSTANYHYIMGPGGIKIFEYLYNMIPINGVYILPMIIVFILYMLVVIYFCNLFSLKHKKRID